jgi:hypothetical protein
VKIVDNRVQVSGQVAVMAINGLLAKTIFEKNPERRVFIEESFPLDWMYPHLEPHGLIMEVRRQPATNLPPAVLDKDRQFWERELAGKVGSWLKPEVTVSALCEQAEKVWVRKDLSGFGGDPKFVANTNACQMYSKLRSAIAGVYAWHAARLETRADVQRMTQAADFAYRQALALCPSSPEAVFQYSAVLIREKRKTDARQVVATALKIAPGNAQFRSLMGTLDKEQ